MKLHKELTKVISEGLLPRMRTKVEDLLPKIPAKMSGQQLAAMLKNNGVTDEEVKWTKLGQLLGKERVTKDEIINHLATHGLPFHTSDPSKQDGQEENHRYSEYALTGGKNYGEKLFHMQSDERQVDFTWKAADQATVQFNNTTAEWTSDPGEMEVWTEQDGPQGSIWIKARAHSLDPNSSLKWDKLYSHNTENPKEVEIHVARAKEACEKYYTKFNSKQNLDQKDFESSHWRGSKNQLFHVRHQEFKDADGKNLWLIEEIQSDWHQKGRKDGYQGDFKASITHDPTDPNYPHKVQIGDDGISHHKTKKEAEEQAAMMEKSWNKHHGVPNAPMKKTWEEMAFKWALHQAVEAKADRIGWITGEIAADRFDISKKVDEISYKRVGTDEYMLDIRDVSDNQIPTPKATHSAKELPDIIGKELADKIVNSPAAKGTLSASDLKVGGHGMKAAYDQRIVSIAKKIAKSTGAMVGKVMLPDAGDDGGEIDPYEASDLEIVRGAVGEHGFEEIDDEDEADDNTKYYLAWDGDTDLSNPAWGPFNTEEEADTARQRALTIREAKTGHEVWYMDITPQVIAMVNGGMRATFESVDWWKVKEIKAKASKPWWSI